MDIRAGIDTKSAASFRNDPDYLSLSRMLTRYQNLILLIPTRDEALNARLAPWQKKIQAELWSPLPFHRTKWLHSVEGARTLLLKLEQASQHIKVQRTRREVVKDLAEKRMVIKRLRSRVEEIGREVESSSNNNYTRQTDRDDESESMYDVLQQIRHDRRKQDGHATGNIISSPSDPLSHTPPSHSTEAVDAEGEDRATLFESKPNIRRRQGKSIDGDSVSRRQTSGYSNLKDTEQSLLTASKEHEDITSSLVSMAAQLKQQARQFQFTLDQDKGVLDRALEGLDQNVSAMGLASKGMKTLQRMSEEQGFLGRLKLQLFIAGMWTVAILLVFAGPKLRF